MNNWRDPALGTPVEELVVIFKERLIKLGDKVGRPAE